MKSVEKTDNSLSLKVLKFIRVGLFLVLSGILFNNIQATGKKSEQTQLTSSSKPASVINTEPERTPIPSIKVNNQMKKVTQPSPSPASDYVKCNISAKCGGGYKEMLKTTCDEMVCCTYSLDYPPMFTSRSDCENRAKIYTKPLLTPDWENQSNYTNPSTTINSSDNEETSQTLIAECKKLAQRTMYDTMSLCPTYSGVQDSTCVARAQETGAQVTANCDNIK